MIRGRRVVEGPPRLNCVEGEAACQDVVLAAGTPLRVEEATGMLLFQDAEVALSESLKPHL